MSFTNAEYQQGNNSSLTWSQQYTYDRWGNRFQAGSGNSGVASEPVVTSDIDAATNRFIASGTKPTTYDAAGNVTIDTRFRSLKYEYGRGGGGFVGIPGYGVGPQNTSPSLPGWVNAFYKRHQGQIDRCINRVFGQLWDGTADIGATILPRQTIRNAPELDVSLTQFQLQGYTQADHTQGTFSFSR